MEGRRRVETRYYGNLVAGETGIEPVTSGHNENRLTAEAYLRTGALPAELHPIKELAAGKNNGILPHGYLNTSSTRQTSQYYLRIRKAGEGED